MKTELRIWVAVLAICLTVTACACTSAPSTKDNNCLTVICTTYVAKEIAVVLTQNWDTLPQGHGYDALQIQILGQAGRDLHSYEPTAADLVSLYNADVFVCLGKTAEPWVSGALTVVAPPDQVVFDMMEACRERLLSSEHDGEDCSDEPGHTHDHHGEDEAYDEHIWMSLKNMMCLTSALSAQLQAVAPHAKDLIQANEAAYVAELRALDEAYIQAVADGQRSEVLIADRNPFVYLMHDYGLICHAAFPGCSSETEASFATQTKLLETVKEQKLPYILQTEGGESSIAKTLADATGADVLTLHACQVMTEEEWWSLSYLDIMESNLENLKKAENLR